MADGLSRILGHLNVMYCVIQELNDPDEQRRRFQLQQKDRQAGDSEAPPPDDAYCAALE